MYKGLIFSMDKRSAVVATPQNAVYKISRNRTMYIGKEIMFSEKDIIDYRYLIKRYSVAAACLCLIIGVAISFILNFNKSFSGMKEYAYISMDINPSVEFTIDKTQKVLKVDPLNGDAEILTGENFNGMMLEDAFVKVYEIYEDKGIIDDEDKVCVLISGSINPDSKDKHENSVADDNVEEILQELKESIQKTISTEPEIVVLEIESKDRAKAFENHLSPSKYALYSELRKQGEEISIEQIKNSSVKDLVKKYNDMNENVESSTDTLFTPEPTIDVGKVFASPTIDLTATPLVTESPAPLVTPTAQLPVLTKNTATKTPKPTTEFIHTPTPTLTVKPTPTPTVKPTPTKVKQGTGLRGEYFDNIDLTNFKSTRVDEAINFYWGTYPPTAEIKDDETYSIRWSGKIRPAYSEQYTFYIARDNGVRLWIDNKLIVDKWDSEMSFADTGKIVLEAGKFYDIKMEYFNNCGNGIVKLEWSSTSTGKAVVPAGCLYPSEAKNYTSEIPGNGSGLVYEYFDEDNLTSSKEKGIDSIIDFNWGVGSPSRSVNQDQKFSIRWTGYIQAPYDEDYVFYVTYDDGASLWVDKQHLVDKWNVSEINMVKSKAIALKAGQKVEIVLLYHNNSMAGKVKLEWESPSIKRSVVPKSCLYPW